VKEKKPIPQRMLVVSNQFPELAIEELSDGEEGLNCLKSIREYPEIELA
jgi:hypothetical protein